MEDLECIVGERQWKHMSAGSGRQCIGTNRQGERCGKPPIVGGFVCVMHGGKSPIVQRAAKERLLALVEPAVDVLYRMLRSLPPCKACGRSDADRDPNVLRAAQIVLDRTGFHPKLTVEVEQNVNPFEGLTEDELIERLELLLDAAKASRAERLANAVLVRRVQLTSGNRTSADGIAKDGVR